VIRNAFHFFGTGTNYFAVQNNGTDAALADGTANFDAGQPEPPEKMSKRFLRVAYEEPRGSVNVQKHFSCSHFLTSIVFITASSIEMLIGKSCI
jgi:hypothetical protein